MKNKETYIAIDFEHVTEIQAICQVGYVYVVDGQPVEYNRTYINPMVGDFSNDNATRFVHHITPEDVEGKETFGEFWKRFFEKYGKETWVFHNAKADISTLRKNLCHAGMCEEIAKIPQVVDTMELYNGNSLANVCDHFGIPHEDEHDALDDAENCGIIYLYHLRGFNQGDLEKPVSENQKRFGEYRKKKISHDVLIPDFANADPSHPFYKKKIVMTGSFDAYPKRDDLAVILKQCGADVNTSISRKTDYVIMGRDAGPAKQKKIDELKQQECPIKVISEEELLNILNINKKTE